MLNSGKSYCVNMVSVIHHIVSCRKVSDFSFKVKGKLPYSGWSIGSTAHLPFQGCEPADGNTAIFCDAWPV